MIDQYDSGSSGDSSETCQVDPSKLDAVSRAALTARVAPSQAKAGDIILARGYEHIGICQNDGCTRVLSNSSSRATFSWQSDRNFGGSYNNSSHLGEAPTEEIYRVK